MATVSQLAIGRYLPSASPIHRMDARAKLVVCLSMLAGVFFTSHDLSAAAAPLPLLAVGVMAAGVGWGRFWRGLRPFLWLMGLAALTHCLATPGRSVAPFPLAGLDWTVEGTVRGATVAMQIAAAAGYSTLLALTTDPTDLVRALERLLRPLERIGLRVGDFCLALVVALRCLPSLARGFLRLRRKGAGEGPARRLRRLSRGLGPLLAVSLRHAERAAVRAEREREGAVPPRALGPVDWVALCLAACTLAAAFALHGLPGVP